MEIKIITPSYKRSDNVKARMVFEDKLIIACHEFEEKEYRRDNPNNEIMVLPDSIRWNMAKVRNYIKFNCGSKYLVMCDDDVEALWVFEDMEMKNNFDLEKTMAFLKNWFEMCEELGTTLWWVNMLKDRLAYREYAPFSLLCPILWPLSCHINVDDGLKYDERLWLNEDYDYSMQVIWKYHKNLRFNKYYYEAGHLTEKGGCGSYRVLDEEKRQAEIMIRKRGNKVVKYDFSKSTNPRIYIPLKWA